MNKALIAGIAVIAVLGIALYMNAQQGGGGPQEWQDGTYVGESEPDVRDQYGRVDLEIADGRITEVTYDEFDSDGNVKGEDYPYQLAIEAQPEFEQRLIETQNPQAVDNISGATTSWEKFKEAADDALTKAAS